MIEKIKNDMIQAMKDKNEVARDILRVLRGEIQRNEQSSKGKVEVSDSDIIKLIKKLIESVKETGNDNGEVAILETYLPTQLSGNEIESIVVRLITQEGFNSPKDMGKIMGYFKSNYDGIYDGKLLSDIVKVKLMS